MRLFLFDRPLSCTFNIKGDKVLCIFKYRRYVFFKPFYLSDFSCINKFEESLIRCKIYMWKKESGEIMLLFIYELIRLKPQTVG